MMEGMLTPEEFRQLNRSLMEKVLDRAASDPAWKQQLLDDPAAALRAAGFPETQRIEETRQSVLALQEEADVAGQAAAVPTYHWRCCGWYTYW
jgi:hypothetical protein